MPIVSSGESAQQATASTQKDIMSFFGKSNSATPTTYYVDMSETSHAKSGGNSDHNCGKKISSGCTPTIKKALFSSSATSISAKKDTVALKAKFAPVNEVSNSLLSRNHNGIPESEPSIISVEDDEVSRLEGSPARSENMTDNEGDCSESSEKGAKTTKRIGLSLPAVPSKTSQIDTCESYRSSEAISSSPAISTEKEIDSSTPSNVVANISSSNKALGSDSFVPVSNSTEVEFTASMQQCDDVKPPESLKADDELIADVANLGRQVIVFWPEENDWYKGIIDKFRDEHEKVHCIGNQLSENDQSVAVEEEKSVDEQKADVNNEKCSDKEIAEKGDDESSGRRAYHVKYDDGDEEWIDGEDLAALLFCDADEDTLRKRQDKVEASMTDKVKKKKKPRSKAPKKATKKTAPKPKGVAALPPPPDVLLRVQLNKEKVNEPLKRLNDTRTLVLSHYQQQIGRCISPSSSVSKPSSPSRSDEVIEHVIAFSVQDSCSTLSQLVQDISARIEPLFTANTPDESKFGKTDALTNYIKGAATRTCYGFRSTEEIKNHSVFEDESSWALWRWEVLKLPDSSPDCPLVDEESSEKEAKRLQFQMNEALKTIKTDFQRCGRVIKAVQRVIAELYKAAAKSSTSAAERAKAMVSGKSTLDAASEVAISGLEDKVTKCLMDVQKAFERKTQAEVKWDKSHEDNEAKKRKREEEVERKQELQRKKQELQEAQKQLRLSKQAASEEAKAVKALLRDHKRKADDESEGSRKREKVLTEKEVKEKALLEKQKSMMSNLFKSAAPVVPDSLPKKDKEESTDLGEKQEGQSEVTTTASDSVTSGDKSSSSSGDNTDSSSAKVSRTVLSRSNAPVSAADELVSKSIEKAFDPNEFARCIGSDKSMSDIKHYYREIYSNRRVKKSRVMRKPLSLSIPVSVDQQQAFVPGESFRGPSAFEMAMGSSGPQTGNKGGYVEFKDVKVDSRKRLFSFREDIRPAYYGTFSKKSIEVNGRRPFAKDMSNNIDYDYDSGEEWGDEEEGEDIFVSDNEDEEEGNEIEYDEFFCHDDEIEYTDQMANESVPSNEGKRGDSVNAIFSAINNLKRNEDRKEFRNCIAGIRFINYMDSENSDSDVIQLKRYTALVDPYGYWSPLPQNGAGGNDNVVGKSLLPVLTVGAPSMAASAKCSGDVQSKAKKEKGDKEANHRVFHDSLLPCLASYVNGRKGALDKLVDGFVALWNTESAKEVNDGDVSLSPPASIPVPPSKKQVRLKIKEIVMDRSNKNSKWKVTPEVLQKCGLTELVEIGSNSSESGEQTSSKNKNKLSFPVVSATEAIESMSSVHARQTTSSVQSTPSNERNSPNDKNDAEITASHTGKGQLSLKNYFSRAVTDCSPKGKKKSGDNEDEEEDLDSVSEHSESMRGVTWWSESKEETGDSADSKKRKLGEVEVLC